MFAAITDTIRSWHTQRNGNSYEGVTQNTANKMTVDE